MKKSAYSYYGEGHLPVGKMTEYDLIHERTQLYSIFDDGDGTAELSDRLNEITKALDKIAAIKREMHQS